jgi:Tfp pilus assembly protein PilF
LSRAIDFYQLAIQKDPRFALAYAGLADCYALQGGLIPPRTVFPQAKAAALRALDLDDDLAEAHTSLGIIKSQYDWEWGEAEHEFQHAIRLNPNYATAHSQYARLLNATGRFGEALEQVRAAKELDPVSLGIGAGLGLAYYLARDYNQAVGQFQKTIALEPGFVIARSDLAAVYLQQNRLTESIREYEAAVNIQPNDAGVLCELGQAYGLAGRREDAVKTLDRVLMMAQQRYVSAPFIAYVYIGLNDRDKAFEMLNKGYDEKAWPLMFFKVEPKYDAVRQDPRFADLARRLGL